MYRKKQILSAIFLSVILLSGCLDFIKYKKYELEEQPNGQYILTSPDGNKYVTYEDNIWYPMKVINGFDYGDPIGKCDIGYIFETESEICIFTDYLRGELQDTFFLEGKVLPELDIKNISNAVLKPTYGEGAKIAINKEKIEEFINLYKNTELHEVKNIHEMDRIWELLLECEQFRGLYFRRPIYRDGDDYYLYIKYQYESANGETTYILCECTSIIESILDIN